MPVLSPKQSARLAAQLNSPPLTWILHSVALRKGIIPGSRRCTKAPSDTKSNDPCSRIFSPYFIIVLLWLPFSMKDTFSIYSAVCMGTEVIALGLGQIRGKAVAAIGIEVGQRRTESQRRDAIRRGQRDHSAQR